MKQSLLIIILISLISFISIGKSFEFALNGDDWLALYRYITTYLSFASHFDIKNYTTNYDIANIIMGLIWRVFEFNPLPYYLVSLIFRIIASLSFALVILILTKDKLASVLAGVFFSVMYAGVETTNWVFNMNTYLSIILLNLFIYYYFKFQRNINIKLLSLLSILIFITFLTAPTRMHGLIFFIPIIVILSFEKLSSKILLSLVFRLVILMLPTIIFRIIIDYFGHTASVGVLNANFDNIKYVFSNLFINIGYSIVPNLLLSLLKPTLNNNTFYFLFGLSTYLIISIYFVKNIKTTLGKAGLIMLLSSISFLIIPGLVNPTSFFPSDHRYLIVPAGFIMVSLSILLATLFNKKGVFRTISIVLIFIITLSNFFSLQYYFNFMASTGRLNIHTERVFSYLKTSVKPANNNAPLVFLFTSNDGNFLYNVVNFGFTPHILLVQPTLSKDLESAPFAVDNFESLKSIYENENSSELYRYGYKPVKIPLENIYSFYVDQKTIKDQTHKIRAKLLEP